MFSFHRPRVYRSSTGCCICKAKSSSSRFTDSKKYEDDFLECFKLSTRRQGEICNACVLLVKRWKKLPVGSDRNWQHVVDARAGPGIKSMTKFKAKNRKMFEEKFKLSSSLPSDESVAVVADEPLATVDDELEQMTEEATSGGSSRTASPAEAASDPETADSKSKRYEARRRGGDDDGVSGFVDPHYWKRETVCCGTVFKGLYGEIMIDRRYYKPCQGTSLACAPAPTDHAQPPAEDKPETKAYSDSSSDSGYDESSNQSALLVAAAAAIAICEDAEEGVVVAQSAN